MLLYIRRFVRLFMANIVVNILVLLFWWLVATFQFGPIAENDPELKTQLDKVNKTMSSSFSLQTEADTEAFLTSMAPIFRKVDWTLVAVVTSSIFLPVGFLTAAWLEDEEGGSDWAPALPVITLLGGQNPITLGEGLATRGVPAAELSTVWQGGILAQQMVLVVLGAYLYQRHRDKKLAAMMAGPPESTSNDESGKDIDPTPPSP